MRRREVRNKSPEFPEFAKFEKMKIKITGKCDSARIEINIQIFQNLGKMKSGKTERRKDGKTEKREDG